MISRLYGIAVAQAFSYYCHYPKDPILLKFYIAILILIDGAHTFTLLDASKVAYLRAEVNLDDPIGLPISLYLTYLSTTMVQSAYVFRVWILSGKKWTITSILVVLLLCQLVSGMGVAVSQQISGKSSDVHSPVDETFVSAELCNAMLCDILISASLVFLLHRSRSGTRMTENMIDRLIVYVIGIGSLTSVFALLNLVTFLAMPDNVIFITFHGVISKLYVNSLLVTLNARRSLRAGRVNERFDLVSLENNHQTV